MEEQVKQRETKFAVATERILKATSVLHETIDHLEEQFSPVIEAEPPTKAELADGPAQTMPGHASTFDEFIYDMEHRVQQAVSRLENICERSAV